MPPITYGINSISPTTGYVSGSSKTATINWTDQFVFYQDMGDGTYYYAATFNLYSAASGGTDHGQIGSYSNTFSSNTSPLTVSASISLSIPSGLSTGTYYVGRPINNTTRKAISVTAAAANITISFDINSGTGTTPTSLVQASGTSFTLPSSSGFSKNGYTFSSWNTNSSGTGTNYTAGQSYTFNNTTTLYAKWTANTYSILINENGGGAVSDTSYTVSTSSQDKTFSRPTAPTGQEFSSWSITQNSNPVSSITGDNTITVAANAYGNITIQANWSYINYTITYDLQGGSGAHGNPTSYTYVTPTITLDEFINQGNFGRTGYTFVGWFDAPSGGNQVTTIPQYSTGNITLYARWSIINYTIAYVLGGGTNAAGNPATYNIESATITFADPTRTGYTFGGWYTEAAFTNSITEIASGSTGGITIYAKWTPITYNISYVLDGGTNSANNPGTYNIESATITLEEATKTGYTFNEWYSDSGFTTQVTEITSGSVGNITLYAKFTINQYEVKFINNGTEIQVTDEDYGTTITAPADPTRTDPKKRYIFLGWHTNMSSTTPLSSLGTVIVPNPPVTNTFYAIYAQFKSSLKINGNDVNIKVGSTQVKKVYKNNVIIWEDYNE